MEGFSVKPILFKADSTSFNNNGIGVLYDASSCVVLEEYNGVLELELEYPVDGYWFSEIDEKKIILAKPNDIDEPHAFRIYEIEKDLEGGVIIAKATSITNDLAGNLIKSVTVDNVTPQQALTMMKNALVEPTRFDLVSDIQTTSSSEWVRMNPLQAIVGTSGSIIDLWGGDVKRTNDAIYVYSRRGRDHATVIRPGKNIDGFKMTTSTKGIITKILPFFKYNKVSLPEYEYVLDNDGMIVKQQKYDTNQVTEEATIHGSVVTSDNHASYPIQQYVPVDYSQESEIGDKVQKFIDDRVEENHQSSIIPDNSGWDAELEAFILNELNTVAAGYFKYKNPGCDEPKVEINADMIELTDSPEWATFKKLEHIQISDKVDVYVKKFDVDVSVTIQAIEYDSIGERVLKITAGSAKNNLVESMDKTYQDTTKELENYINNLENGVYNTINKTANGQSKRFEGYTEPPASISTKGDMWFKKVGAGKTESYVYDGTTWVQVIGDDVVESMNAAIVDAKETADDAAQRASDVASDINNVVVNNGYTTLDDLIASKVSSGEYGTLFAQNAKSIGLFYTVNGETEAMIVVNDGIPYIKGNNIVLDGDTIVDGTFTVTDTMLAADAVIEKLKVSGIDAKDVRILNLDASSITGGDLTVTESFRIMHNGFPVLSVDAATGQVKIQAPNLATKEDLDNVELTPGPAGEDAWKVEIISSNGNIFKAGAINTVLDARVYKGSEDVTDTIPVSNFKWKRVSEDTAGDLIWNDRYFGGTKTIVITTEDVYRRASFFCEVIH